MSTLSLSRTGGMVKKNGARTGTICPPRFLLQEPIRRRGKVNQLIYDKGSAWRKASRGPLEILREGLPANVNVVNANVCKHKKGTARRAGEPLQFLKDP